MSTMSANKYSDIISHTFGNLTVTGLAGKRRNGERLFYCSCSCGKKSHIASKHQLVSGGIQSCGCYASSKENLRGKIFTNLTVIEKCTDRGYRNGIQYLCACSCGNTVKVLPGKLKSGEVKSCGCLKKEMATKYSDLVGNRYGRIVVIKKLGRITTRRDIFWECLCDCGNTIQRTTGNLTSTKGPQGCGCIKKEIIQKYRISVGKDPNIPIKQGRIALREKLKKLKLDKLVFKRDKYTCQLCAAVGVTLHAHHIIPVSHNESMAFDTNNLITLCKLCHFEKAHGSNYKRINIEIQSLLQKINSPTDKGCLS